MDKSALAVAIRELLQGNSSHVDIHFVLEHPLSDQYKLLAWACHKALTEHHDTCMCTGNVYKYRASPEGIVYHCVGTGNSDEIAVFRAVLAWYTEWVGND